MEFPRLGPHGRSRTTIVLVVAALLVGLLGSASPAAAANTTYVTGPISVNTLWTGGDTWVMIGNVTVLPGVTLTIERDAFVKADPGVHLYVRGTLIADGRSDKPISFAANKTASNAPWGGVQFNASSTGSVSWSTLSRAERALYASQSSPSLHDNVIDSSFYGIVLEASSSVVTGNRINYTNTGIQAMSGGDVTLTGNTITNVTGSPALGIYVTNVQSVSMWSNTIQDVVATNGRTPLIPGGRGTDGGYAVAILVNGTTSATMNGNVLVRIYGGQGGNGAASPAGNGGRGGDGGPAGGMVTFNVDAVNMSSNTITNVLGGDGGNGGSTTAATGTGGNGGNGGTAAAVEGIGSAASAVWSTNFFSNLLGGSAGDGGISSFGGFGNGGLGADVYGFLTGQAMGGDANWNTVKVLRGGHGGNSSNGVRGGSGGSGGQVSAFWAFGVDGTASIHDNLFTDLKGGGGGAGRTAAGAGGNATGILAVGNGSPFNQSSVRSNTISLLTGGPGGVGTAAGGTGGVVTGFAAFHVQLDSASNRLDTLLGGQGGNAFVLSNPAGRGGDATAFVAALLPAAGSSGDTIQTVTKGAQGVGTGTPVSYGVGFFAIGDATVETRLTITNGTLSGISDLDINVDNYTDATTVNTPFSTSKFAVQKAANLTVRNFLAAAIFWPDNSTPVSGASVRVFDDGILVWDVTSPSGFAQWLLVTDRVYMQSKTVIHDNQTQISASYPASAFWNSPRFVDMAASHTEAFGMVDKVPPTSSASPLPPYENSLTFSVLYTYTDGNGTGVQTVSLWYRSGSPIWTYYATQTVPSPGGFTFTASGDGTYEFYTIATDVAGNAQAAPSGNNTWTIVDTVRPGSHVNPLSTYETALTFAVSWDPDPSVTDILSYTVQYNTGSGWNDWLTNTHTTSGMFTAGPQGPYAFRSIATDVAGNVEVPPAGNDTWTIVDTFRPSSHTLALPVYETASPFVVMWGPQFDSFDIATYRIQVQNNGGGWTDWIPSTALASGMYSGQDGHTYEFQSIATDRAGNPELPSGNGNDSWTIVDMSPPDSTVNALPAFVNTLQFGLGWGPVAGTSDIDTYRVQWQDGTGPWTDLSGYSSTTSTGANFVGQGGHVYAFRTIARDHAGNLEIPPATNDTWTVVDVTPPAVTNVAPVGANTNTTPWISIMFSEPMDRASVEGGFSLTPAMNGGFVWNADSTAVTFIPARSLDSGTSYFVALDTGAHDRAGNGLVQSKTFAFSTEGFSLLSYWWILAIVAAAVGGILFWLMRRRNAPKTEPAPIASPKESDAIIEDVFLLNHRDGVLIKHETRRLRPDVDTDILSGMLTAVQQFVKDALRGDEYADLNEMTVGHMHILIGRGRWLVLAARIEGDGTQSWTAQIERCIKDMEDHHWDQLEDWDGDMALARLLTPYVKKLIQGGYAQPAPAVEIAHSASR